MHTFVRASSTSQRLVNNPLLAPSRYYFSKKCVRWRLVLGRSSEHGDIFERKSDATRCSSSPRSRKTETLLQRSFVTHAGRHAIPRINIFFFLFPSSPRLRFCRLALSVNIDISPTKGGNQIVTSDSFSYTLPRDPRASALLAGKKEGFFFVKMKRV